MKCNWYRDVETLLDDHKLTDTICNEPSLMNLYEYIRLRIDVTNRVEKMYKQLVSVDIERMNNSSKMPFCKNARTHCRIDNIMNENVNWNYIALLVQLKVNMSRFSTKNSTVKLNGFNSYFDPFSYDTSSFCNLCSLNNIEDIFHILFICPAYEQIRNHYLSDILLPGSISSFIACPKELSAIDLQKIWKFLHEVIIIRNCELNLFT
jgi:hypothetical protein